jgi:hypothetical protein
MTWEGRYDEERLGRLLTMLRPAPEGWVRAAQELPSVRSRIDEIVALAEADSAFKQAILNDLEAAIADAGYEPAPLLVEALRKRLSPI